MTTNHSTRQPTALGRRLCMAIIAFALSAVTVGAGASASQAAVGSVYWDTSYNAAAGEALFNGTFTGVSNVGLGRIVMPSLTSGNANVSSGAEALVQNTTGSANVASGFQALRQNHQGNENVALGSFALLFNNGSRNVATGTSALENNTTGNNNVAIGRSALSQNTAGNANVALGQEAGRNLTTGSNNIAIANPGKAGEAGTIRIGGGNQTATFIAGIRNTALSGQPVVVNSSGRLGVAPAASASSTSLATTVDRLTAELERQQHQIDRLRERVRGG